MQKGEIKKKNLLETAEKLFFEKGYHQTSIQELVDAFHCTKGSFYHHFESKLQILSEVCALRSGKAFEAYKVRSYVRPMDRLNGLLYYAMPFRHGQEEMLTLLLPVADQSEKDVVLQAILRSQEELFLPEIEEVLEQLKADGTVFYSEKMLIRLLWDSYSALYGRLLDLAGKIAAGDPGIGVASNLQAARFMWERLLDAPFAGIQIVGADEVILAVRSAALRAKAREEEQ